MKIKDILTEGGEDSTVTRDWDQSVIDDLNELDEFAEIVAIPKQSTPNEKGLKWTLSIYHKKDVTFDNEKGWFVSSKNKPITKQYVHSQKQAERIATQFNHTPVTKTNATAVNFRKWGAHV